MVRHHKRPIADLTVEELKEKLSHLKTTKRGIETSISEINARLKELNGGSE